MEKKMQNLVCSEICIILPVTLSTKTAMEIMLFWENTHIAEDVCNSNNETNPALTVNTRTWQEAEKRAV